jgi:hypothetical protein
MGYDVAAAGRFLMIDDVPASVVSAPIAVVISRYELDGDAEEMTLTFGRAANSAAWSLARGRRPCGRPAAGVPA